jgi:diguanylate cyclase (GGDEF)-like protein
MVHIRYLAVLVAASALFLLFAHSSAMGVTDICFFLALLWATPLSIRFGNDVLERGIRKSEEALTVSRTRRDRNAASLDRIQQEERYLENKLTNLATFYALTKEMSCNVRFHELFNSLQSFLGDNLAFRRFVVMIFAHEGHKRSVTRVYEITGKEGRDREPEKIDEGLARAAEGVATSKKPVLSKEIVAIPLVARRKVIGVMLAEETEEDDYSGYVILASQVALQIERISLFENIERLSVHDGLTGVFLRRHFLERFVVEVARAKQCGLRLAVAMVDLDFFKKCNDRHGHLVGDVVLRAIAEILTQCTREIDLVARFGGEEFCMLLPGADKEGAYLVAERIRKTVETQTIKAYDESIRMTVSIGISAYPDDAANTRDLIEHADRALYQAKREGRNRVCVA